MQPAYPEYRRACQATVVVPTIPETISWSLRSVETNRVERHSCSAHQIPLSGRGARMRPVPQLTLQGNSTHGYDSAMGVKWLGSWNMPTRTTAMKKLTVDDSRATRRTFSTYAHVTVYTDTQKMMPNKFHRTTETVCGHPRQQLPHEESKTCNAVEYTGYIDARASIQGRYTTGRQTKPSSQRATWSRAAEEYDSDKQTQPPPPPIKNGSGEAYTGTEHAIHKGIHKMCNSSRAMTTRTTAHKQRHRKTKAALIWEI